MRPARHRDVGGGRHRAAHDPDHARGDRPPAHLPRDARRRRPRVRDGDLLARARAAAGRRRPRRGRDLHQPDAGPPRLPSDDGGLLRRQAAPVRVTADERARGQCRRSVRPPAGRGVPRRGDVRDRCSGRVSRRRRRQRVLRHRLHVRDAGGRLRRARAAPGAVQRLERSGGVGGGAGARGPARRAAIVGARAGAVRADRRRPAVRGARRLRAHAGLARERPARGARALGRPRDRGVRRGRRPRSRQAAADGRDRRPARGRLPRHLRQPALGGSGGDHRRDPGGRGPGGGARRRPAALDRARDLAGGARRRGGDRRQGARAGPGVRRRAQGAVRRRDGRPRGAALARTARLVRRRGRRATRFVATPPVSSHQGEPHG